jgi:hypothetical protein
LKNQKKKIKTHLNIDHSCRIAGKGSRKLSRDIKAVDRAGRAVRACSAKVILTQFKK